MPIISGGGSSGGGGGGTQFDFVARTTDFAVTATSAATATVWIQGNAVTYGGSQRIKVEAFCALVGVTGASFTIVELYDDSGPTDLGRILDCETASGNMSLYGAAFLTPSAGSHTYSLRAWRGASNGALTSSSGLGSWLRITSA